MSQFKKSLDNIFDISVMVCAKTHKITQTLYTFLPPIKIQSIALLPDFHTLVLELNYALFCF